jgi:uncharacterized protein (DUF1800 family)
MAEIDIEKAAHACRRLGFSASPEEIDALVAMGSREAAIDHLVNYERINNSALDILLADSFDFSDQSDNQTFNQGEVRRWWFTRMVHSRRQFEEKMTLFWHDHFATALSKVAFPLMFNQNMTLRTNALGRFDDVLLAIAKDPAMIVWLDTQTNIRTSPNENLAREILELFSMGIFDVVTGDANYTELDIQEIARAFTGWRFRTNRAPDRTEVTYQWFIQANQHDNGLKNIFGTTANWSGEEVVTAIAARRSTARYLTWKLFNHFVYPMTNSAEDKATINRFADVYDQNNHSIKALVTAIFKSDEFFSERARFSLVKSPVELVVGAVRMLGQYNPGRVGDRQTSNILLQQAQRQGQEIMNPPDVDGWDGGLLWINTSYMLERFNFANIFVSNRNFDRPGIFVTLDKLNSYTKANSKKTVKKFLSVLGPLDVGKDVIKTLKAYLEANDAGQPVGFTKTEQNVDKKVRALVHQIMNLPEFMMN